MKLLFYSIFLILNCFSVETARIGFIFDGEEEIKDSEVVLVKAQIQQLLAGEMEVEFKNFTGDWTLEGAKAVLDEAFKSDVDVIVSMGFLVSMETLNLKDPVKPVVMAYDVQLYEKKPDERLYSNKIAYFKGKVTFYSQIAEFMRVGRAKRIGVVSDKAYLDQQKVRDLLTKAVEEGGGEVVFLPVTTEINEAQKIIKKEKLDGVIFLPTPRLSENEFNKLVGNLQIPSFSFIGESEVDRGILMSMTPDSEKLRLARRLALNVQEMILSKDNSQIVVDFFRTSEVIINEGVMSRLSLDFTWDFLSEAKIVGKVKIPKEKILNLQQAVSIALDQNLNYNAEINIVKSGNEQVKVAQSNLLPQARVNLTNRSLDAATARAGFGSEPENLIKGNLRFTQLIYDERLFSNFEIERYLQASRVYNQERVELNTILFAAVSYIRVLKLQREKEIAITNIALSKANLRRAYELVEAGQRTKREIYRWESEVSLDKDQLAEVQARLESSKAEFNQVLNKPAIAEVYLTEVSVFEPSLYDKIVRLMKNTESHGKFEQFKAVLVDLARKRVPEIKVLEERVLAQKRLLKARKREFVVPSVFAFADLGKFLAKQGAGSTPPEGLTNTQMSTSLGVTLSYPIVTGGRRIANKNKAQYDLCTVELRKKEVILETDVRVIKATDRLKSSYDQIFFSKRAKEAADQNLQIVINSYVRGTVSIVDLLDAQNIAINSMLSYANAVYDFLIDYIVLQRAVGDFDGIMVNRKTEFDSAMSLFLGESDEK